MSKATHVVRNGDRTTGLLWDSEKLGKVFVLMDKIDPNFDLEIYDIKTNELVNQVDLREFLLKALPHNQK
ncbi:hypothetical protein [Robertmurraya siralis]|uniref:hypothetical protein n=1 Tax=Robertmurraya siralis TaxID=77777 RepID=UPI0010F97669|nr:hypothetical protein [Robertmurraya siralis]